MSASFLAIAPAAWAETVPTAESVVVDTAIDGKKEVVAAPGKEMEVKMIVTALTARPDPQVCRASTVYALPQGFEYVPGSLVLDGRPVTDASNDDWGAYDQAKRLVRATFSSEAPQFYQNGCLYKDKPATLAFKVKAPDAMADDQVIAPEVPWADWSSGSKPVEFTARDAKPPVIRAAADLRVTGSVAAAAKAGGDLEYRVKVENRGPAKARTVVLTSALPHLADGTEAEAAVALSAGGTKDCRVTGSQVSCAVGDLAPGTSAELRVGYRLSTEAAGRTLDLSTKAETESPDLDPGTNVWQARAEVPAAPKDGEGGGDGTPKADPSATLTPNPSGSPSASASPSPNVSPSDSKAPEDGPGESEADAGGDGSLADTGSQALTLAGAAAVLAGLGGGAVYVARRRRATASSED
ncbi:LPXTG cell wall anchor domain-containing protein [Streptomyces sp. NPDC090021]|uniref:LPXTG cell wall anchor domain-containing protein n=1 Tax=Streptomyces sp. NPDC090021 TaxID=3365919 RepID=UPI0037F48447